MKLDIINKNKKADPLTMYKRNAGESAKLKQIEH